MPFVPTISIRRCPASPVLKVDRAHRAIPIFEHAQHGILCLDGVTPSLCPGYDAGGKTSKMT